MFPNSNKNANTTDLPIDDPAKSMAREEFFNTTDKKVYNANVHREFLCKKLIFDINLEERRMKLRELLEKDENTLTEEHLSKIETLDTRVKNLKEAALRIRRQTELERQHVAETKKMEQSRLNDDGLRFQQHIYHKKAIHEDWEKLKDIKERLKREEECTESFWKAKRAEIMDDLDAKERKVAEKKELIKKEILQQLDEREKEREVAKAEKIKNQKRDMELSEEVHHQLAEEKVKEHDNKIRKQASYHNLIDNHIRSRAAIKNRNIEEELAYETVLNDENLQKLKDSAFKSRLVIDENYKSMQNFMHYQDCIRKEREEDEKKMKEKVLVVNREIYKKNLEIEREKVKRFNELIKNIKNSQKQQFIEAQERKKKVEEEKIAEKLLVNQLYEESIKKDKVKVEEKRAQLDTYFQTLKQQLEFNKDLNNIRKTEKARERESMDEAEKEYIKVRDKIRLKENILFLHPWRVR